MPLNLRWVGEDEAERVARTRTQCYAGSGKQFEQYLERLRSDRRAKGSDFLLAERDGQPVGTATSLSLRMWVRGAPLPCQGVAWVGAIKTERRRGGAGAGEHGVATQVMREMLRMARERGEVISALMPFRTSYYEHFGYGAVERRCEWTVPMSILPAGPFDGIRFSTPDDLPELMRCYQRVVESGQGDVERGQGAWDNIIRQADEGFLVVDRPKPGGPIGSWLVMYPMQENGKEGLRIGDMGYESIDDLRRQLQFLASLRDQHAFVNVTLPFDVRLNWLLKERQVPHRPVNHPFAMPRPYNRLQARVLDHEAFLNGLHLPTHVRGGATIAIREPEETTSVVTIDVADGRATATSSRATPDVECDAVVWSAIAFGALPATSAAHHGLIRATTPSALTVLDALSVGPAAFSHEYF